MTIGLCIDGRELRVDPGTTVMEAAAKLGMTIPGLCHLPEHPPWGSCMVCVVEDVAAGRLLPACATRVTEGMQIATASDAVLASRRQALELLFSEHLGDCEAPCRMACPATVRVAEVLRELELGRSERAAALLTLDLGLPGLVCGLCHAPCAAACRRAKLDAPLGLVELFGSIRPVAALPRDERPPIAVVGGGPAGMLSAAQLRGRGYPVLLVHRGAEPGGSLRQGAIADDSLLARAAADLGALGVELEASCTVGEDLSWEELAAAHALLVVATGEASRETALRRAESDRSCLAVGSARAPMRRIAEVARDVRRVIDAADRALNRVPAPVADPAALRSRLGRLDRAELLSLATGRGRTGAGASAAVDPVAEAERCLQCGCLAAAHCELRRLAASCGADPRRYRNGHRPPVERSPLGESVVHEPGKCIRCGRCVRLAATAGAPLGMAFMGRGAAMRVVPPFGESAAVALGEAAARCVAACPTGALIGTLECVSPPPVLADGCGTDRSADGS